MTNQRCEHFCELVSAFVDERLDGAQLLNLEEHLRACPGCRGFEGELRRFRGLLRAAEALRPLRRPPSGFAGLVVARIAREPRAPVVPFPAVAARRRFSGVPWIGIVAAAAAAVIMFAWTWQRLLPVGSPEQKVAVSPYASGVEMAAATGGSMDAWMRAHSMLARGGTLLGSAEESEFARINPGVEPAR